ncbi:hypothetical protein OH76DRAFT_1343663 [Lentinus brumalis]|uniref:Uncharacterized protein n=1 Tax=Lentinus brumalis TaxID=2498619 RepID=A0A371DL45_9APHY|nr:hypothetical protein OH76DRAFT_1343663 [Polyporus brumalis]
MSSVRWTGAARASLIILSFLVHAVHSFIPASPSNSTDATANLLNATLNVFWFSRGQLTMSFARAAATSDSSGVATGALVHYTDDTPSGTTKTPWVALVACDQNATNATPDDIFARAKNSGAQAGVLYSLFSSTCIVNPGYSNPPLDVYVSDSLPLLENVFRNVDAVKFGTFNPETLDSEFAHVTSAPSNGFTVDPGYTVAVITPRLPIFSSVYTALPTSTGSDAARTSATGATTGTATSLAPNSTATSPSGNATNENAAVFSDLPML